MVWVGASGVYACPKGCTCTVVKAEGGEDNGGGKRVVCRPGNTAVFTSLEMIQGEWPPNTLYL